MADDREEVVVVPKETPQQSELKQKEKQDPNPFNPSDKDQLLEAKRKKLCTTILKVFVVFLGFVIISAVLTSTLIMTFDAAKDKLGPLSLDIKLGKLLIKNQGKKEAFKGTIGKGVVGGKLYKLRITSEVLFYEWINTARLLIQRDSDLNQCVQITWSPGESGLRSFQDCYNTEDQKFYGGSELYNQQWPLNKASIPMQPFLPRDFDQASARKEGKVLYGPVLERLWISSNGIAIIVDDSTPLHISFNENQTNLICLKSDLQGYPGGTLDLKYKLCMGENIQKLHQYVMGKIFKLPRSIPDERMIKEPIWSTWVMYGTKVMQSDVLTFADRIAQYNFPCSQIEIDDKYSCTYGDFDFDKDKFPNATDMISTLHFKGFRVTMWVYPFTNTDSPSFLKYMGDWVRGPDPEIPGLVSWWNGIAGALDTTNEKAVKNYINRLKTFQSKYNIDGFKFDAGSLSYVPVGYSLYNKTLNNPSVYSSKFAEAAAEFGSLVEARVGYRTQELPIFIRILDRASHWGYDIGLKSVIPSVMMLGILGYPYVLPDMIGGNGPSFNTSTDFKGKPEKELYIRWVQMNTFLPAMQFSYVPWMYDNETLTIVKQCIDLRAKISPVLIQTAKDVAIFDAPIIRPLWWFAPNDDTSLEINSQFILGDMYLVAPVLDPATVHKGQHKVYFPPGGTWMKEFGAKEDEIDTRSGGKWITYDVSLADLPYFSIVKSKN